MKLVVEAQSHLQEILRSLIINLVRGVGWGFGGGASHNGGGGHRKIC